MKKLIASLPPRARRLLHMDAEPRPDNGWRTTEEGKHYRINKRGDVIAGPTAMVGNNVNEHKKPEESAETQKAAKRAEYQTKLNQQRKEVLAQKQSEQALFVYEAGYAGYDDAVEAMNNGTASDLVNQYFDIMEKNGDPTPTKPARVSPNLNWEIEHEGKWKDNTTSYDEPYLTARTAYIREWTGMSEEEAIRTRAQMSQWFGPVWSSANTEVLDEYIDRDGVYDGEIYRGLKFSDEEYERFMQDAQPGGTVRMVGRNSSWTTDMETAINFAGKMSGIRHVVLKCVKNKTSAPVDHLSTYGEGEVLAHSRAQWTVLRVEEGDSRTVITVVEAEERMSEQERDRRREEMQEDAMPEENKDHMPLAERMAQQSKFFVAVPPPPDLKEKLSSDGMKESK